MRPDADHASFDPTKDPAPPPPPPGGDVYEGEMTAREWFAARGLLRKLLEEGVLQTSSVSSAVHGRLLRLEQAEYVRQVTPYSFALTPSGRHVLEWAGAPKPTYLSERRWATDLAREIARVHCVEVHAMLRSGRTIVARRARARLCYALYARGWPFARIREQFGIEEASARSAVDLWRKERDERRAAPVVEISR